MLKSMRAVVTPQTVINNCMDAARTTEDILEMPLSLIDHFSFHVFPDDYAAVSDGLSDTLTCGYVWERSFGKVTMGLQKQIRNPLTWRNQQLPGLAVSCLSHLPLTPGGGYVAFQNRLSLSSSWLQRRGVNYYTLQLYGTDALWVPLSTPEDGVGDRYYALCVVGESLFEATRRLQAA